MKVKEGSTRNRVKSLMNLDQRCRDDDRYLILAIWEQFGFVMTKEQRAVYMHLPSGEIITRRRREFSKLLPPSIMANERRYRHFREFSEEFSKQNWLQRILKRKGITQ